MKPFLRWEYDFYINVLNIDITSYFTKLEIALSLMNTICNEPGADITVNEIRKMIGVNPHPDTPYIANGVENPGNVLLNRGAAYIGSDDVPDPSDDDIPTWVYQMYGIG